MERVVDAGYEQTRACKLEHATSAKPCFATNATIFVPGTWSEPSLQTAALSLANTDRLSNVPAAMQEVGLETSSLNVQTQNGPALCV